MAMAGAGAVILTETSSQFRGNHILVFDPYNPQMPEKYCRKEKGIICCLNLLCVEWWNALYIWKYTINTFSMPQLFLVLRLIQVSKYIKIHIWLFLSKNIFVLFHNQKTINILTRWVLNILKVFDNHNICLSESSLAADCAEEADMISHTWDCARACESAYILTAYEMSDR